MRTRILANTWPHSVVSNSLGYDSMKKNICLKTFERETDMKIPLNASVDKMMRQKKQNIIKMISEAGTYDDTSRRNVIARLRGAGFYMFEDDIDLLLAFDPKSCTIPYTYCNGICSECHNDPLAAFLEPYSVINPTFILTRRDILDALLDSIDMLARACKIYTCWDHERSWLQP